MCIRDSRSTPSISGPWCKPRETREDNLQTGQIQKPPLRVFMQILFLVVFCLRGTRPLDQFHSGTHWLWKFTSKSWQQFQCRSFSPVINTAYQPIDGTGLLYIISICWNCEFSVAYSSNRSHKARKSQSLFFSQSFFSSLFLEALFLVFQALIVPIGLVYSTTIRPQWLKRTWFTTTRCWSSF